MLTVRLLKKNILYKRNIPFYQLLEVIISYFQLFSDVKLIAASNSNQSYTISQSFII